MRHANYSVALLVYGFDCRSKVLINKMIRELLLSYNTLLLALRLLRNVILKGIIPKGFSMFRHIVFVFISVFLCLVLVACSSGGGIDNAEPKPGIVIQPISFDISKHAVFTTTDIYEYISDEELGGNPHMVEWNQSITAQHGDVDYTGNGRFTYTPRSNIPSGQDSFSFRVLNDNGTSEEGLVTLNISGWNTRTDLYRKTLVHL